MTIRDQLICIDDLERRGHNLHVGDVLGLISYLREQRACKVALILNDEQLDEEARKDFDRNLEKIVDLSLVYEPRSAEAVRIAITEEDQVSRKIAEYCVSLGITNIRVIRRIPRFVTAIKPMLDPYDAHVFETALRSIVLFSWSHDQPDEAPTFSFLKTKTKGMLGVENRQGIAPKEAAWNALLEAYGYFWTDEFDLVLMDGVHDGYFDPDRVRKTAQAVHEEAVAEKGAGSFEEAWRRYHDSFENNQDDVLDGIYSAFMGNMNYITPTNLNGTVRLFKDLGRPRQASEMVQAYVANRRGDREFFDLDEDPFGDTVDDPEVRAAFREKAAHVEETRDAAALMLSIQDGWDEDRLRALATLPIEEYKKVFQAHSGPELRRILANVFQFDRVLNATDQMREIPKRAREALKLIGAESPINARRVSRYGVVAERAQSEAQ
jgi:hypothetical protein